MRQIRHYLQKLPGILLLYVGMTLYPVMAYCAQERLTITGTGSGIGTMKLMAKEFTKKYPHIIVEVLPNIGTSGAIKAVRDGKIDIGLGARPMNPEEKTPGMVEQAYGRTAFMFAVPAASTILNLTLREIEDIVAGKRTMWSEGKPLRLVLRPKSDAYWGYLAGISPAMKTAAEQAHNIPGVFIGITEQDAAEYLETREGAFGITSACLVASEKRKIKGLAINWAAPTLANVSSGVYPYTMTISVIYRQDTKNSAVNKFLDFIFSPQGYQVLIHTQHLPLKGDR
jgi:phosphate transport system substrate-binding protein